MKFSYTYVHGRENKDVSKKHKTATKFKRVETNMKGEMTVNDVTSVMVGEDGASTQHQLWAGAVHQNHGHHGSTSSRKN